MKAAVAIVAGVVLGYAVWRSYEDTRTDGGLTADGWIPAVDALLNAPLQGAAEMFDQASGSMLKISSMSRVDATLLGNRNVQAMLKLIRTGEGTAGPNGYQTLYGGGLFSSFADHPRQRITKWGLTSTAAGAYQFLSSSWDETARIMGLKDFSPRNQDLGALGRIVARGALPYVLAGDLKTAVRKINKEWASMPESPYGQKTMSWDAAAKVFASAGGVNGALA